MRRLPSTYFFGYFWNVLEHGNGSKLSKAESKFQVEITWIPIPNFWKFNPNRNPKINLSQSQSRKFEKSIPIPQFWKIIPNPNLRILQNRSRSQSHGIVIQVPTPQFDPFFYHIVHRILNLSKNVLEFPNDSKLARGFNLKNPQIFTEMF